MDTRYSEALGQMSSTESGRLSDLLDAWEKSTGRVVVQNLRENEFRLPIRIMQRILKKLAAMSPSHMDDLPAYYEGLCHQYARRGPRIRLSSSHRLGRVVSKRIFEASLYTHDPGVIASLGHARRITEALVKGTALSRAHGHLRASRHTAWVTFSTKVSEHPFAFLKTGSAQELQATLGLDPRLPLPLMLVTYTEPRLVDLRKPTVADAGVFPFFRPSRDRFGWTVPWPIQFLQTALANRIGSLEPRPEGVHMPIPLSRIERGARVIRR